MTSLWNNGGNNRPTEGQTYPLCTNTKEDEVVSRAISFQWVLTRQMDNERTNQRTDRPTDGREIYANQFATPYHSKFRPLVTLIWFEDEVVCNRLKCRNKNLINRFYYFAEIESPAIIPPYNSFSSRKTQLRTEKIFLWGNLPQRSNLKSLYHCNVSSGSEGRNSHSFQPLGASTSFSGKLHLGASLHIYERVRPSLSRSVSLLFPRLLRRSVLKQGQQTKVACAQLTQILHKIK